jgi:aspartate/methionine/tyrosine aminotransferase
VEPTGGCVAFPRFRDSVWKNLDVDRFYETLNRKFKTYVGPGHWFEQERRHMRLGYGWPGDRELRLGLERISEAIREVHV